MCFDQDIQGQHESVHQHQRAARVHRPNCYLTSRRNKALCHYEEQWGSFTKQTYDRKLGVWSLFVPYEAVGWGLPFVFVNFVFSCFCLARELGKTSAFIFCDFSL